MSQVDAEITTRILIQAQNDAVIVERLKRKIEELSLDDESKNESSYKYYVLKELEKILDLKK